jgi:hypothetical protein
MCVLCLVCLCVCHCLVWSAFCVAAVSVRSFGEVLSPKTGERH